MTELQPQPKGWVRKFWLKYSGIYLLYLRYFKGGQYKTNLLTRKEKKGPNCLDCGACCKLGNGCICFDKKTGKCKIWDKAGFDLLWCKAYPMTPLQLEKGNLKSKCRYYWDEDGTQ